MKTKKRLSVVAVLFIALALSTIQSCKKYTDGPTVSFRTRTERVANTWKIDNYKVNGTDFTSLLSGYTETFSKDGSYSYEFGLLDGTGKWEFQNNDMEIKLTGISSQSSQTLFIMKLEEKQFWYYYMDGNDKKEFHLIEK